MGSGHRFTQIVPQICADFLVTGISVKVYLRELRVLRDLRVPRFAEGEIRCANERNTKIAEDTKFTE